MMMMMAAMSTPAPLLARPPLSPAARPTFFKRRYGDMSERQYIEMLRGMPPLLEAEEEHRF